jgi:hypothetical protein
VQLTVVALFLAFLPLRFIWFLLCPKKVLMLKQQQQNEESETKNQGPHHITYNGVVALPYNCQYISPFMAKFIYFFLPLNYTSNNICANSLIFSFDFLSFHVFHFETKLAWLLAYSCLHAQNVTCLQLINQFFYRIEILINHLPGAWHRRTEIL